MENCTFWWTDCTFTWKGCKFCVETNLPNLSDNITARAAYAAKADWSVFVLADA